MINQSFHSVQQFIAMGGFGDYVWSAYGITAVVVVGLVIKTVHKHKKRLRNIQVNPGYNHASQS